MLTFKEFEKFMDIVEHLITDWLEDVAGTVACFWIIAVFFVCLPVYLPWYLYRRLFRGPTNGIL